jgi:putative heme-binding domain-containing protein
VLLRTYHREHDWDGQSWWRTRPNSAGPYYQAVTWEMSEAIADVLRVEIKLMNEEQQKELLFHIRRHNLELEELNLGIAVDPIEQLVEQSSHSYKQLEALLSAVGDDKRPESFRIKAFRAALGVQGFSYKNWCVSLLNSLGEIPTDSRLYETLSQDYVTSPAHRISLMQQVPKTYKSISKMPKPLNRLFCDMVNTLILSPLTSSEDREKLIGGMKQTPSKEFLESIGAKRVRAFEKFVELCTKNKNKAIAVAAEKTLGILSSHSQLAGGKLVGQLDFEAMKAAIMNMSGDTEEGKKLFLRQSCVACHSVLPSESQKGPYLGTVGNLFNREQIITHIVKPGAEVAQGFQAFWFKLKDGSTAEGFVTARDEKNVTLRNIVGLTQVISLAQVKEEGVREGSMMPLGLVNGLSLKEFASLVDYLQSLH